MILVRMAISLYGKAKLVPGYIKHPPVEWIGDDQVEGYVSSEGKIILEIHKDKVKIDDARREIPKFEQELAYNSNQVGKIKKELQEGRLGRKGDLDKFEAKVTEIHEEIRIRKDRVDSASVDRIEFLIEDCN